MTLVLAAVAVAQLTAVQSAPSATAAPAQSATGSISGTVKNGADDTPLPRARVTAVSADRPEPRVAIAGADGKYAIGDLPPGSYTISATRTGYAPYAYGQGQNAAGEPVRVAQGQQVAGIDLPMTAGGVISGRILDEDGAPFAGATVDALVMRSLNGIQTLTSAASAATDDRGEFRLFGLAPGSYFVSAADPAFASVRTPKGVQRYSPTYYPGTPLADRARRVTVTGSGEPPRVEFKLQLVPPANVSGRLIGDDGRALVGGTIVIKPVEGEGLPAEVPDQMEILPDGRFRFVNVAPGRYQIRARAQTDPAAAALFAVYSIEMSGTDVGGIQMVLRPGAVLDGKVIVESSGGRRPPDLTTLRVRAPFIDGTAFGDSLTGLVQPDGSYALRGVMKGVHQIAVDGLPDPWVLKSVTYRGSDITDVPLAVEERQRLRDIRIVISDAAAEVSGIVVNARKLPVASTGVLVGARVPVFWMRTSRRLRVTFTDQAGRWRIAGLPPGEYFAVAAPMVDHGDLGHRDRLEALAAAGTPFSLESDAARPRLTLQLTPVVPAAAAR
jgi:protocatechuate 3,4-dioxygenase beta subunit